jgi:PDZ domain
VRTRLSVLIGLFALAGPAPAQPDNNGHALLPRADLERLVAALDADDPAARENATRALAEDQRVTLRRLEPYLSDAALTREQRRRLLSASFERFAREPRAAMGVSFEPLARESGLRLATVVPTFPCAAVLKAGDRVLAFDGVALRDQQHAVATIIAHDPGDEIEVSLQRQGEALVVAVPLGRRDRLDTPVPASGQMLVEAWTIRAKAFAADVEPAVVDSGLAPGEWTDFPAPDPRDGAPVIAGGEPRGGFDPALAGGGRDGQVGVALDATILRPRQQIRIDAQGDPMVLRRRLMREEIERLTGEVEARRERLRRNNLTPEYRRALEREIQRFEEDRRNHERELRAMDAQFPRPPR